jgi:hypothetical protein
MRTSKAKAAFRARRAADAKRHRERRKRGCGIFAIELGADELNLLERFGELPAHKFDDRAAVASAFAELWRRAVLALLREHTSRRGELASPVTRAVAKACDDGEVSK